MEEVITGLIANSPIAAAVITIVWMFLAHIKNESAEHRRSSETQTEQMMSVLQDNTAAIRENSKSTAEMREALIHLEAKLTD